MLNTKIDLNLAHDEFLMVYLLTLNRLAELRAEVKGMTSERESLATLRLLNNLQVKCWGLERLLFPGMERTN